MTALLVVGVVLLGVVAGLSVLQRRRQRDVGSGATPASGTAPRDASDPSSDPDWPFRTDPYWGELMWDHERGWEADDAPALGSEAVRVHLYAGREGPGAEHREWYEAARGRGDALMREAAEALAAELGRRGVDFTDLTLDEVRLGRPEPAAGFQGVLAFDPDHEALDWLHVRSTDVWRTLIVDVSLIDDEPRA